MTKDEVLESDIDIMVEIEPEKSAKMGIFAGAGNIYRHDYPHVDPAWVWNTVHSELPPVEAAVRAEFDALGPDDE